MFELLDDNHEFDTQISFDGKDHLVPSNITVAAAALLIGAKSIRETPVTGAKRMPLCMMGVCYECLMKIDGVGNQRSCQTLVRQGMVIERQIGATEVEAGYYEA
ncbi:MAG: (2Fe-2S)-binding protein [Gammaproteobacteria bacterium]|jgi:predicted molibdopterin-dependent oxidoreductase YjgC|nr:(2Fe-2S)-binding protein [Gammaproteobacteria bacterium]